MGENGLVFILAKLNVLLREATRDSHCLASFHLGLKNVHKRNLMGNLCASHYAKALKRVSSDLVTSKVSFLSKEE